MIKITPKIGFILLGISFLLSAAEIFVAMILGLAASGANSGLWILKALRFIFVLTATVGILAPICGILNKNNKINIGWKLFSVSALMLSMISFFSFGGLDTAGRWSHYVGGGSYMGSNPSFSPDGMKIIFSSPNTGHGDIYLIDTNGFNLKRLTTSKDYEGEPIYSHDGSKICFIREQKGRGQVFIMDKNGNNQKQLTFGNTYFDSCSFSPDDKQVAYYSALDRRICMVDTDATNQKCLTNDNVDKASPVFSSNGKIFYYTAIIDEQWPYTMKAIKIWELDINTLQSNLVSTIHGELYGIKYSSDFKKIVYTAFQGNPQQYYQIFTANIDGTSITQLTNSKEKKFNPSFSHDGSKITFLSGNRNNGYNVVVMDSDGSNLKFIHREN